METIKLVDTTLRWRSELFGRKISPRASAAQQVGAPTAMLLGSALCFVMILAICAAIPQLWRYKS